METTRARPWPVTVVAVLLALSGIAAVVLAVSSLRAGAPPLVLFDFLYAAAMLYVAYGLYTLRPWAWVTAIAIQVINAAFAIMALVKEPNLVPAWISLAVAAVLAALLLLPRVREAFRSARLRI